MNTALSYALMDPTGNMTLLVETPVPVPDQPAAAARLMEREPTAEQVGFLTYAEGPDAALRMAGGEFCGNAAMSAAALCAERLGLPGGRITVRVSGTPEPTAVELSPAGGGWRGAVAMPRPRGVADIPFPDGSVHPGVRFDGITHVILEQAPDRAAAEALAPALCRRLGADALGLMYLDRDAGTLTPLVYVPAAGTLFWESSCASGTAAAGVILARRAAGPVTVSLAQPGGVLSIAAAPDGSLTLSGAVTLCRRETVTLSL